MVNQPSIFISYSTLDKVAAQKVRNLFEERGHDALLLKLQQHMTEDFIMDLLRNEVKARDWVVAVDSLRADKSHWVAFERSVASIYRKPIYYVDANCADGSNVPDAEDTCLRSQVNRISRRLFVFLSYSHQDAAVANRIEADLQEAGYETFSAHNTVQAGGRWQDDIRAAIDETLERGVMLVLVSEYSVQSAWTQHELTYGLSSARARDGIVIPVLIPPVAPLPYPLQMIQALDMTQDLDRGIEELLDTLQHWT